MVTSMSFGGPAGISAEEFAAKLTGREIGNEITREEAEQAKQSGLVVVYGASDDLMEFEGAISEEYGIGELLFTKNGKEIEEDDLEVLEKYDKHIGVNKIIAEFENGAHSYKTEIPHVTFDILEDGEVFCEGIVFWVGDLI